MEKEISKSFIDALNKSDLSAKDIGGITAKILSSNLSSLLKFKDDFDLIENTSLDNKEKFVSSKKTIECYIASCILKAIEKGNTDLLKIMIQNQDDVDKDLYELMEAASLSK